MIKSYLKSALRNMTRRRLFSATMIAGLALGILSSFLLLTYVLDQFSYDRYLPDSNRIYRITSDYRGMENNFAGEQIARCYYDWIRQVENEYPQVVQLVKFNDPAITAATANEKTFRPDNFYTTDSTFFDLFRFKFIRGSRVSALQSPMSIVLSEKIARKYFGSADPVGRTLKIRDQWSNSYEYHITGVMEDVPANSHFHPEFVARWPNKYAGENMGYYYILLKRGASLEELEEKLGQFVSAHLSPKDASGFSLRLQPLTSIHLYSHLERELEMNGSATQVYALLLVALLVIGITCINYVNLAIARKTASLKDVGVRRVLGASTGELFAQNIAESTAYVFLSLILVLLLYEPSMSALRSLMNLKITAPVSTIPYLSSAFAAEIVFLILISGGYPAFVVRKVSSAAILGSGTRSSVLSAPGLRGIASRRVLLIIQFSMAILLISAVMIVSEQMKYVANIDMGYDTEQLVALPNIPFSARGKYTVLKKEITDQTGVVGMTSALEVPSEKIVDNCQVFTGGGWESKNPPSCEVLPVDRDFISVMKIRPLAGNSFRKFVPADLDAHQFNGEKDFEKYFETTDRVYIINQAAMKAIGCKTPGQAIGEPIGIRLDGINFKYGPIVGVVRNFHFNSLHDRIEPIVMFVEPLWFNNVLIRVRTKDLQNTLSNIKNVWSRVNPGYPFDYDFINNDFAAKYVADNQFKAVMGLFSSIAIIIACIGLFAVSLFTTERRIKEIGIRRVLGASEVDIISLLTRDFLMLVAIGAVIGCPVAYYLMNRWLQGFAYRINLNLWAFLLAAAIA
ncbi:MAG TPA: ABC transporter permease, partial [Candidatus Kryptobacter bacterium]|nr:ABC transporter permease [Candidatus Kryptobacter bacterium]